MAAVLDALASYLQNMLMEMANEEVHMLLGVSGEIDKMGVKLGDLKNFLADADRRNITDLTVQEWVTELRDSMYDATDILDLCQLKAMDQGPSRDMGCFNPLLVCMRNPLHTHDIGSRIKRLNQRLDDIKARSTSFNFVNLSSYEDRGRKAAYPRSVETTGGLDESGLVSERIEEDTRNLVDMLIKDDQTHKEYNKFTVFAIVGVGGIGKTTLAKKIFNNDIIQQAFTKKIWLSINKDYDETEILRRAITECGGDHQNAGNTKSTLERTLIEVLKGHKTLLIMDDVWDNRAWEGVLRTPLVNANLSHHGVRILVTTRHDTVARGMMAEKPYHRVNKLEPEDAWLLLKKQVVRNENDEGQIGLLKDIGMKIVEKCDCLPLAIKVMGGLLRQKNTTPRDWGNVLNDSIWSESQMPEELNYAIYLSYEDLHPSLKPCFLHFSLLPKSNIFSVHDIVGMWISEGFVHGTSRDLEDVGKEYYEELIQRNLIEPDSKFMEQQLCNMHDVVRSFAQYVARNEALVAHHSEIDISDKLYSEKFIRLSLQTTLGSESSELEWFSLQAQSSLRTLILVGYIKINPGDSLRAFPNLRTLHIEDASFDALAASLIQLKHLRYLSIQRTNTSRLPENIGMMKFLQYISLSSCESLADLPTSISKLQQLRYLNLLGTSIKYIHRGFNCLTSLRKLHGFPAHMDGDRCSLEDLGPLSNLMELEICGLGNVSSSSFATKARLAEKPRLIYLGLDCTIWPGDVQLVIEEEGMQRQIEDVFDELCSPPCLEHLVIRGYFGQRFPRWMASTTIAPLRSLRTLMMYDLVCCTDLPNVLCQLPCLEFLKIVRAPAIKHVGSEFLQPNHHSPNRSRVGALFPRLSRLNFNGLLEWEEWEWEEQVKAMPTLDILRLQKCKLRHLPPGLAFHARELNKLYIYNVKYLGSLENFTSVVHLDVQRNVDLERISNLPKLQKLIIVECPKMKVLEGMPALQRLNLEDYDMETVPRYLQDVNPRHLLLCCSVSLLICIAAGKSCPEWNKFSHIQQVKARAGNWHVIYTRDPFRFETNISRVVVAQARSKRTQFAYSETCPVGDEWPIGRHASADKHQPLCLRFRCNAYRYLILWLRRECLHCSEAQSIASSTDQWTEAAVYPACIGLTGVRRGGSGRGGRGPAGAGAPVVPHSTTSTAPPTTTMQLTPEAIAQVVAVLQKAIAAANDGNGLNAATQFMDSTTGGKGKLEKIDAMTKSSQQSEVPESSAHVGKNGGDKQPYCFRYLTKGHTMQTCTAVMFCDVCVSQDHTTARCPRYRAVKMAAVPCGYAVEGLGFYYIPQPGNVKLSGDNRAARIVVTNGTLTSAQVTAELERLVMASWNWNVMDLGGNKFRATFPSQDERRRMIEWGVVNTKFNATMEIEAGVDGGVRKFELPKVWIQFTGLPKELREIEVLWVVGSILGVTKDVDMGFTRKFDINRIKVMVLDPNLIPQAVDVVIGDYLYGLQFRVEKGAENSSPVPMDMDGENDADDGDVNKKGEKDAASNYQQKLNTANGGNDKSASLDKSSGSGGKGTQRPLFHLVLPGTFLHMPQGGDAGQDAPVASYSAVEDNGALQGTVVHNGYTEEELKEMENEDLLDDEKPRNESEDDFASKVATLAGIPEATLLESPRVSKRRAATSADDSLDRAASLKAARNLDGMKGTVRGNLLAPVLESNAAA